MRDRREQLGGHAATVRETAASVAQLRADQRDPAHGGRTAQVRGAKNAAHQRAVRDWTDERPDSSVFMREIFPGLQECSVREPSAATVLSEHYCSLIRLGKRVPHPCHWEALRPPSRNVVGERALSTEGGTFDRRAERPPMPSGGPPFLLLSFT